MSRNWQIPWPDIDRHTRALVRCIGCKCIMPYDDRTSCPHCGAPIQLKENKANG